MGFACWVGHSAHTLFITWVFLVWLRLIPLPDVATFFFGQTAVAFVLAKNLTNVTEEQLKLRQYRLAWTSKQKHRVVMTTVNVVTDLYLSYLCFQTLPDDLDEQRIVAAALFVVWMLLLTVLYRRNKSKMS